MSRIAPTPSSVASLTRTTEEYEAIKYRPLILVFRDWFIAYSYNDPQANGYETNMGEYYQRHLMLSLDKKLSDEIKLKPFFLMSLDDLHQMILALKEAVQERLEVGHSANKQTLIFNSINFITTAFLDGLAYFGVDNGGCGNDTKHDAPRSFEQQPIPASAVAGCVLMMNLFLAFRQDANNHFTEIVENALIQILKEVVKKSRANQAWRDPVIDDDRYQAIISKIEDEHHRQHFHENLRFRMRFITAATFLMRGFISSVKIAEFVESSFSREALCMAGGLTSSEFNAATLQITNLVNALQGIIRVASNSIRKETFENQFRKDGVEGIMDLVKGKISDKEIREILLDIFDPTHPLKLDSHQHGHRGHAHGHDNLREQDTENLYSLELGEAQEIENEHGHHEHGHSHQHHGHSSCTHTSSQEVATWKYYFRKFYGGSLYVFNSMFESLGGDSSKADYKILEKKYEEFRAEYKDHFGVEENYKRRIEIEEIAQSKKELNKEFLESYSKWEQKAFAKKAAIAKIEDGLQLKFRQSVNNEKLAGSKIEEHEV